jgi:carbonic anhydrase/acetyltransferase-like protein (isoleucine patch superfamily)
LKERAYIGHNSVVLEGAIVEYGAIVLPNSVVPPGRVVPSMQLWGGNPIKFVRHAKEQEAWVTLEEAREQMRNTYDYREQFLPYNNAYLYKPNEASVIID